jgi:hypothetical protein
LNAIVSAICRAIAETRIWLKHLHEQLDRDSAEAAAKAEVEAERLAREQRKARICSESEAWQKATVLRAYAKHIADTVSASDTPLSAQLHEWIELASAFAEELDPTNERIGGADNPASH